MASIVIGDRARNLRDFIGVAIGDGNLFHRKFFAQFTVESRAERRRRDVPKMALRHHAQRRRSVTSERRRKRRMRKRRKRKRRRRK